MADPETIDAARGIAVLHVAETLPGGIASYLNEILPEQGAVLGFGRVHVLAPSQHLGELTGVPDAAIHGYDRSGRNLVSFLRLGDALIKICQDLRPTVVHLHSSFAGVIGRVLAPYLAGRPRVIYCPHGWAFSRDDRKMLRYAYVIVEKLLADRADAWIAISNHELEVAGRYRIGGVGRLVVNGLRDTQKPILSTSPPKKDEHIDLLFVGRHDRQKGLDLLLAAMEGIDDRLRLFIAGSSIVAGHQCEPRQQSNVTWLGWLSSEQLAYWYRACDMVVVPSRWEGFGLVAIEAMRESRPVLAARRGALAEIVEDGVSGRLFDLDTPAQLSAILQTLTRENLAEWGRAARQRYLQFFSGERMNIELLQIYSACGLSIPEHQVFPS